MKITPGSRRFAYLTALLLISGFPERALSQTAPPNGAGGQEVPANKSSGAADKAAPPGSQEVAKDTGTTGGSDATKAGAAGNMSPEQAAAVQAALDAQKGATTQADAALAGAAGLFFGVSPQAAKPYMTVTFHYRFAAPVPPAQGTYYVNCMRQDLADNSPDNLGQKNLNAEWQNGVIAGEYSLRMLKNASLYGNYSFRIFGPYKAMVDASTLPTSVPIPPGVTSVEVVQHGKIHDEGRFAFGSYQTVLTAPAETAPRHRMTITWADASVHQDAAIGLFKSGTDNQHSLARMMFANLPGSWDVDAPAELGSYEVRAFIDGGTETTGTRPFKVTWGTVQPVLSGFPAACYPFAYMPIDYANGPSDHNAWIGIFDVTNNGTNTGWSHESLQGKTSGELFLAAPANIGRYDIRMFDGSNNRLARSTAFQVVAGSEAIQLKAAVDSGHIVLTWNNPRGYQGLDGYYVYRGTAAGAESSTPLTVGPIPADRSAAAATAVNTHIDAGAQPGTKYYYVVKPLQIDHTTLGAASNEVSATAVAAAPPSSSDAGGGSGGGGPPSTAATPSTASPAKTTTTGPAVAAATGTKAIPTVAAATPAAGKDWRPAPANITAAPGATAEFTKVRRLGETDALLFSMKSAEYEGGRMTFGDDWMAPQAGEKLLVVRFHVTNPRRESVQFNVGRFQWTVVDAQGASIHAAERAGLETDPATMEQMLPAGGACDGLAVFRVPGAGEMQSITVTNPTVTGPAAARFDLRGQVRALPARYADDHDRSGATVAEVVAVRPGEMFPCGKFDVELQSVETIGADTPASEKEEGLPVYATVRYTLRGAHAAGVFGAGVPVVTMTDSQGVSHSAELQTFELKAPETTDLEFGSGETHEFRLRFWIPRGATPRQVVFQERGGIPVRVDVAK